MAVKSADWLNAIPAAILLQQGDRIVFANTAAADLIGCSADDLAGVPVADVWEPLSTSESMVWLKRAASSPLAVSMTVADVDHEGQTGTPDHPTADQNGRRARRHRRQC